mgnify:CR=1 FL=1
MSENLTGITKDDAIIFLFEMMKLSCNGPLNLRVLNALLTEKWDIETTEEIHQEAWKLFNIWAEQESIKEVQAAGVLMEKILDMLDDFAEDVRKRAAN